MNTSNAISKASDTVSDVLSALMGTVIVLAIGLAALTLLLG